MQDQVVVVPSETIDWYTVRRRLGSGTYGNVWSAYDDRAALVVLRNTYTDAPIPEILFASDLALLSDPPTQPASQFESAREFAGYLAQYNYGALTASFPRYAQATPGFAASLREGVRYSRYEVIRALVKESFRLTNAEMREWQRMQPVRNLVAIKYTSPTIANDINARVTQTEVFALSRTSSNTPVYFRVDGEVRVRDPTGCYQFVMDVPLIACLQDYFYEQSSGNYAIVITYVEGMDLHDAVVQQSIRLMPTCGPRPFRAVFCWYAAWSLMAALDHAHSVGIIHNDVKPENVLWSDETRTFTLLDWGLSCTASGEPPQCATMGGSADYLTKEMVTQHLRVPAGDVWASGIVLWELASGLLYNVPGDTVVQKANAIRNGAKPDIGAIPSYAMWRYPEFVNMVDAMLSMDHEARPEADDVQQLIVDALSQDVGSEDYNEIGEWLRDHV